LLNFFSLSSHGFDDSIQPAKFTTDCQANLTAEFIKFKKTNPRRRASSIDDKKPIKPSASDANSSNLVQI